MNDGPEYVVASREGLYIVNHAEWQLVADGYFFGVTVREAEIFCFKIIVLDENRKDAQFGQIVRYRFIDNRRLNGPDILVDDLDYNCHQIDFFNGSLFVVDTRGQRLLEFDESWRCVAIHQIVPPAAENSAGYAHLNSFFGCDRSIYVMLHNQKCRQPSEIIEFDRKFIERRRITLPSTGCHDIVRLEDGRLLFCESREGRVSCDDGSSHQIDKLLTRGLAVGEDEIAVGSSLYGSRIERVLLPGFVTFLDRSFCRIARLYLPAAPTQIRRLDGRDLSLSRPR